MAFLAAIPAMFGAGGGAAAAGAGAAAAGSSFLGKIGQGMNLAGTVSDAMGSLQQGNAINAAGMTNADIARRNARLAAEEGKKKRELAVGAQTTAYAKAGVVPNTGTPLQVMANTVQDIELETLREKMKWLYHAEEFEDAATAAKHSGILGSMTKGLGGFGTFLGKIGRIDPTIGAKALWGGTPGTIG